MACFVAPAVEAVVVSTVRHVHEKREKKQLCPSQIPEHSDQIQEQTECIFVQSSTYSGYLMSKLQKLSTLLWGGSFLLLIEHIWHGEIVPWFPFFTAFKNPGGILPMLYEIATVGTAMAFTVTAAWLIGTTVCYERDKKRALLPETAREG